MVIHIHEASPPSEDIIGNDTNVVYIENGTIKGNDNFTYLYADANPTVTIGGSTSTGQGTLRLGGASGKGTLIADTFLGTSNNGMTFDTSGGPGNTLFKSLVTINGVATNTTPTLSLASTNPVLGFTKPTNGANMKNWNIWLDGSGNLFTDSLMDDGSSAEHAIQITRTGRTVTSHRLFANGSIILNVGASSVSVATDFYGAGNILGKTISSALNPATFAGPTNTGVTLMEAPNYADIGLYDATQAVNARAFDIINFQNKVQFRLKNDSGANVVIPLSFNGGYAGYTGIASNSGTGTWNHTGQMIVTAAPTAGQSSLAILNNTNPSLSFHVSGYIANRRRWEIGAAGAFFTHSLVSDDGLTKTPAYAIYNGTNTIGGHNWYLGTIAQTNPTMTLQAAGLTINMGGVVGSDPSSILELQSTTQGFLPPRMTTVQMHAIANPAQGLIIVNTTTNQLAVRFGTSWYPITAGAPIAEE
jgi:hypothetical protein